MSIETIQIAQTTAEKEAIYAFRYQVYIEEMQKPYANADHDRRMLYDDLDEVSLHLFVQIGEELAGSLRLSWCAHPRVVEAFDQLFDFDLFAAFPLHTFSVTSWLVVAPQWRSTKVTRLLFHTAYELSAAKGDLFNFIHCSPRIQPIMQHYGFQQYRAGFQDDSAGTQIPMVLALADAEHFQAIRSPFVTQAKKWFQDQRAAQWLQRHLLPHFRAKADLAVEV